jgi:hypothetical protein
VTADVTREIKVEHTGSVSREPWVIVRSVPQKHSARESLWLGCPAASQSAAGRSAVAIVALARRFATAAAASSLDVFQAVGNNYPCGLWALMIVFDWSNRSRVWRMRAAFPVAMLLVLSETAWTSAQEPTSTDVSRLEREDVQTTDGFQRIDSDPSPLQGDDTDVRWTRVLWQTLSFQAIQHGFLLTEERARRELRGPWFQDWAQSAASPFVEPHWSDGGTFFVNYIAHPMGGSVYAYIYRQNDPSAMRMEFGGNKGYVAHLTKASGIAALSSLQWEIGPFSEASLENRGKPPDRHKMAWVDIVITPTLGVAWMAGEDALDRYVIERLERKIDNAAGRGLIRILLNPTRSMANVVAGQKPWKRYRRP